MRCACVFLGCSATRRQVEFSPVTQVKILNTLVIGQYSSSVDEALCVQRVAPLCHKLVLDIKHRARPSEVQLGIGMAPGSVS